MKKRKYKKNLHMAQKDVIDVEDTRDPESQTLPLSSSHVARHMAAVMSVVCCVVVVVMAVAVYVLVIINKEVKNRRKNVSIPNRQKPHK